MTDPNNALYGDTVLGRYLPEDSYFSPKNNAVKPKAFIPPPNLKLSTCNIDGLNLEQIWELGLQVVNQMNPPKLLYGIGQIQASKVLDEKLTIIPDGSFPRHRNICNWPDDKSAQHSIAEALAAEAELISR